MTRVSVRKIGIFDHAAGTAIGGAQFVNVQMARVLSEQHDVELIHTGQRDFAALARAFDIDLSRIRERRISQPIDGFAIPGPRPFYRQLFDFRALSAPYDVFVYSGHGVPPFSSAKVGLIYCHFPVEAPFPGREADGDHAWSRRRPLDRWLRSRMYGALWHARMRSYRLILANSVFTARWIERRFGREATVIYPPVAVEPSRSPKQNVIVSVGRFAGRGRSKNQHLQIAAFRDLIGQVPGEWALVLIGSCGGDPADRAYLHSLQSLSHDLPVHIVVNADRAEVKRRLATASVFWHTCGLGVDETRTPELAEHFGIATVEAMGAGCVPVVAPSGGQREIVRDGEDGFLCDRLDHVVARTAQLARNEAKLGAMREAACRRSARFTVEAFRRSFAGAVAAYL